MFFVAALGAIGGAMGVVVLRNPFYSVLALVVHLVGIALLFLLLRAEFLAAAQLVVYAGAVMVLYVFVVAYIGGVEDLGVETGRRRGPARAAVRGRAAGRADHRDRGVGALGARLDGRRGGRGVRLARRGGPDAAREVPDPVRGRVVPAPDRGRGRDRAGAAPPRAGRRRGRAAGARRARADRQRRQRPLERPQRGRRVPAARHAEGPGDPTPEEPEESPEAEPAPEVPA